MIALVLATVMVGVVPANVGTEVAFASKVARADPFNTTTLDVVFTTPSGRSLRVPAFWAGGTSWKVRYASGELGIHRYRSECSDPSDAGLHGVEGSVEVVAYKGTNPFYQHGPIQVGPDRRHFTHADGTPFFWLGDTWWMGLCNRLRWPEEFATLTADRKAKGFNVVQITAGLYPDMAPFDPRGANDAGFPWEKDYARIRPEFFDDVDKRINYVIEQGLSPCVVGMWGYFLPMMGEARATQHWRYLIARYGAWPVTWCVAGEANLPYYLAKGFPYDDREQVHGWTRVARSIRATDPFHRPLTIHPTAIGQYTARHAIDDPTLLDFDMLQTPHGRREAAVITLKAASESYRALPVMPVINGEASFERLSDNLPTEWTRAMFWICMASGAGGHTYGANGIWQCNRRGQPHGASPHGGNYGTITWDEAMNLPGSSQVAAGKRFLEGFAWQTFKPHPEWISDEANDRPVPAGVGEWIWFPEGEPAKDAPTEARYFRRTFEVPTGRKITQARLLVAADDRFEAWINGRSVGSGGAWTPDPIEVASALQPGKNVVAIRARNLPANVPKNPAGLLVTLDGSEGLRVGTGRDWRSSRTEVAGWLDPGFDDSAWSPALVLGPAGIAPWGPVRAASAFPALALGIEGGPRLIYRLDPRGVTIRGFRAGASYRLVEFDPVALTTASPRIEHADSTGQLRLGAPSHGHDSVVAIVPDVP